VSIGRARTFVLATYSISRHIVAGEHASDALLDPDPSLEA
jgi:hypothetical protein